MDKVYSHESEEYQEYINSEAWKQKREEARHIHGDKCKACAHFPVDIHHLTYARFGGDEDVENDLIPLCRKCHQAVHLKYEKEKSLGKKLAFVTFEYIESRVNKDVEGYTKINLPIYHGLGKSNSKPVKPSPKFSSTSKPIKKKANQISKTRWKFTRSELKNYFQPSTIHLISIRVVNTFDETTQSSRLSLSYRELNLIKAYWVPDGKGNLILTKSGANKIQSKQQKLKNVSNTRKYRKRKRK